ncbi:hypothetical protein RZS08_53920, partial [Arthrospira platensis SPKY1]|nr:hypothetical protein [Arthrospira platensis SPKY1]
MKNRHNFTLSPEAVQILRALADKNGVSMSAQLELLIRKSSNQQTMTRKELLHQAINNGQRITTESHAVGGGEWSLEVYADGKFLFELVGPNGTRDGE